LAEVGTVAVVEPQHEGICCALEAVEDALPDNTPLSELGPGHFKHTPWQRTDHHGRPDGGGMMGMMSGQTFEKLGAQGFLQSSIR
jgi:coproporphyrinogen III oxidase